MEERNKWSFPLSRISTAPSIGHLAFIITMESVAMMWCVVTDMSIIGGRVDRCEMWFKKRQCFKENRPSAAADAFSSTLDKEEIPSSSPLLDPCSPWSFVPIVSSPKPSGARSFPLSVLSWEEQRNDLMIYSGGGNCSRSVANWMSVWPT